MQPGQHVILRLGPDPTPDHVDLPPELSEAFEAWPEAQAGFDKLSGAMQRAIAQHIGTAKQPKTRARRGLETAERLAHGRHPFRK